MSGRRVVKEGETIVTIAAQEGLCWDALWLDERNRELRLSRKDPEILAEGDVVYVPDRETKSETGATETHHCFKRKGVPEKVVIRIVAPAEEPDEEDVEDEAIFRDSHFPEEDYGDVEEDDEEAEEDYEEGYGGFEQDPESYSLQSVPDEKEHIESNEHRGNFSVEPCAALPYLLDIEGQPVVQGETTSEGFIEFRAYPDAREARLVIDPGTPREETFYVEVGYLDPISEVSGVQARLNNIGFNCGSVDGSIGPRTADALKRFQADVGLEPNGELDGSTRDKLVEAHEST
jgi:N-acetylmuramoyl-L-alanine amidase